LEKRAYKQDGGDFQTPRAGAAIVSIPMPAFEKHCEQTMRELGDRFEQVHVWLDELAGQEPYGMRHRRKRHHAAGIEEARRRFGDKAAEAARMHIEMDLMEEGWTRSDPFPRDERHYIDMGIF
jgi:hypothetical protein